MMTQRVSIMSHNQPMVFHFRLKISWNEVTSLERFQLKSSSNAGLSVHRLRTWSDEFLRRRRERFFFWHPFHQTAFLSEGIWLLMMLIILYFFTSKHFPSLNE